jgi:hypothetical protein
MGIKETLLALSGLLETIPTTNQDGGDTTMYVSLWNNQIERKKEGSGFVYQTPACFIETNFSEGLPIGGGATSYEVIFRILIEHENYNTEGTLDQDLIIFDIKSNVHRKLNAVKLPNCSPLFQSGKAMDYNHDNVYLCVLEYSTHFIDFTGSALDTLTGLYVTETLTNPSLVINTDLLPDIPIINLGNFLSSENWQYLITENNNFIVTE